MTRNNKPPLFLTLTLLVNANVPTVAVCNFFFVTACWPYNWLQQLTLQLIYSFWHSHSFILVVYCQSINLQAIIAILSTVRETEHCFQLLTCSSFFFYSPRLWLILTMRLPNQITQTTSWSAATCTMDGGCGHTTVWYRWDLYLTLHSLVMGFEPYSTAKNLNQILDMITFIFLFSNTELQF